MARPVTLFTGQWADLTFEEICRKAEEWGYDGLEIACWGDHMEVKKAADDPDYVQRKKDTLEKHGPEMLGPRCPSVRDRCLGDRYRSPPGCLRARGSQGEARRVAGVGPERR